MPCRCESKSLIKIVHLTFLSRFQVVHAHANPIAPKPANVSVNPVVIVIKTVGSSL